MRARRTTRGTKPWTLTGKHGHTLKCLRSQDRSGLPHRVCEFRGRGGPVGSMWDVCVVGLGSIPHGADWSTFPSQKGGLATCYVFLGWYFSQISDLVVYQR